MFNLMRILCKYCVQIQYDTNTFFDTNSTNTTNTFFETNSTKTFFDTNSTYTFFDTNINVNINTTNSTNSINTFDINMFDHDFMIDKMLNNDKIVQIVHHSLTILLIHLFISWLHVLRIVYLRYVESYWENVPEQKFLEKINDLLGDLKKKRGKKIYAVNVVNAINKLVNNKLEFKKMCYENGVSTRLKKIIHNEEVRKARYFFRNRKS